MKTLLPALVLLAATSFASAQTATPSLPGPPAGEVRILERGPHHRILGWTVTEPTPYGGTRESPRRVVELASGLHYQRNGQWLESREVIESYPGGSIARQGAHRVIFARNLSTAGAIDMELPDGQRLRSHPVGLAFLDCASGSNIFLARIKDCEGFVDGNQVIYPDAFSAPINGSVRYTYTRGGLEQDIILDGPDLTVAPEDYGLDPRTTVLQVLTEFIAPPVPVRERRDVTRPDGWEMPDENLRFGATHLGPGRAFRLGETATDADAVPVTKRWVKLAERTFLIEELPFPDVERGFARTNTVRGASLKSGGAVPRTASVPWGLPNAPRPTRDATAEPMMFAHWTPPAAGFVLDYATMSGITNDYTFQADTTYYISGRVDLYGSTVLEGGTVLKFADVSSGALWVNGPMQWDTGLYRPVVFSSKNDNSVGEQIQGSTGNPQRQQHVALVTAQSGTVRGARFLYARTAICPLASLVVEDAQWADCDIAVDAYGQPVTLRNGLFAKVNSVVNGSVSGLTVTGEHLTGDAFNTLVQMQTGNTLTALKLTNCLFTAGTNWVVNQANPTLHTNAVTWLSSSSGVYQTAAGGRYYLAANSPYRDAGVTNASAAVAALVRARTTYPPVVYSNITFTTDTTFNPQTPRVTDTPDRGYHYAPLDYAFGGCHTAPDLNLTVTAATALGWFRTNSGWTHAGQGLHLGDRTVLTFAGTATAPTWWVRLTTVQETDRTGGYGPGGLTSWAWPALADAPRINARFLRCATLTDDALHIRDDWGWLKLAARDCEFYSGGVAGYNSVLQFTNGLFYRSSVWVSHGRTDGDLTLRNCTFHGASFQINRLLDANDPPLGHAKVSVRDCAFDRTAISTADVMANDPAYTDYGWNAYRTNTTQTTPAGANNVLVTNFNWQAEALGNYYLLFDSPLVNAGSLADAALAGLYHHTTQTNQTKEAASHLDIAYHYVACDANGNPVDTDSDGLPDYQDEDSDGDDLPDAWEFEHFGNLSQDWDGDYDEDEVMNGEEYLEGTDPNGT